MSDVAPSGMFCVGAIMGDCIGDGSMTGGGQACFGVSEQRMEVAVGRHGIDYGIRRHDEEIAVDVMTGFRTVIWE
jgi:hypothetical protein